MQILNTRTTYIDTAVGPMAVQVDTVLDPDIDDYFHDVVLGVAKRLRLNALAAQADQRFTGGRSPVTVGDTAVGGYNGR